MLGVLGETSASSQESPGITSSRSLASRVPGWSSIHRRCLIDQHDRDVVLYRVDAVTLLALQAFWLLAVFEPLLAFRTNQNIE